MRTLSVKLKCEKNIVLKNKLVFIDGKLLEYNDAEDCYKVNIGDSTTHDLRIEVSRVPRKLKNVRQFNNYYINSVLKSKIKRKNSTVLLEIDEEEIYDAMTREQNKYCTNIKIIEYKINKLKANFSSQSSVVVEDVISSVFDAQYKKIFYIIKYNILFIVMFLAGLSMLLFLLLNPSTINEASDFFKNGTNGKLSYIELLGITLFFIVVPIFNAYHFIKFNKKILFKRKTGKTGDGSPVS